MAELTDATIQEIIFLAQDLRDAQASLAADPDDDFLLGEVGLDHLRLTQLLALPADKVDAALDLLGPLEDAWDRVQQSPWNMGAIWGCDCGCGGDSLTDEDADDADEAEADFDRLVRAFRAQIEAWR